jgi:hypothetical protein
MPIEKDNSETPARGEAGLLLLLLVIGLCGLLMWTGLFLGVEWSLSTAWTVMVAHQATASSVHGPPDLRVTAVAVP